MRISDWSSDVCSSDLQVAEGARDCGRLALELQADEAAALPHHDGGQPLEAVAQQRDAAGAVARVAAGDLGAAARHVEDGADELPATAAQRARPQPRARQSVAKGKRVSVPVDHGGRRLIKKQQSIDYSHIT